MTDPKMQVGGFIFKPAILQIVDLKSEIEAGNQVFKNRAVSPLPNLQQFACKTHQI